MSDLREGFEAWALSRGLHTIRYAVGDTQGVGDYQDDYTSDAWAAWQASRQHDGHAEFVRAVMERVNEIFHCADSASLAETKAMKLLALCDVELSKERNNG